MEVDRAKMDKAFFAALKPGGYLVIADHSARPGDGTTVGKTFHRIEEATLRQEVEAAGFKLVAEGNFLRNPDDPRDAPCSAEGPGRRVRAEVPEAGELTGVIVVAVDIGGTFTDLMALRRGDRPVLAGEEPDDAAPISSRASSTASARAGSLPARSTS